MSTVFVSSALDKVKALDVTRQSGLVVTNAKANLDELNINKLLEKIRNNPFEIMSILGRLQYLRFDSPKSLLEGLKRNLLSEIDYERQNAISSLTDRLSRIIKDRALIGNLSYNELLRLTDLMQEVKSSSLLKFKDASSPGGYGYYPYAADHQNDVANLVDGYTALYPDAELTGTDAQGLLAVNTQLITTAAEVGAIGIIRDIVLATTDPIAKAALIASVIESAMAKANFTLLMAMLDDTTIYGLTIEQIKGMYPNWLKSTLENYTEVPGMSVADAFAALNAFLVRMNNGLNGAWWKVKRVTSVGVTNIPDLEIFQKSSPAARKLFQSSADLRVPNMIADSYPVNTIKDLYKATHPMVLVLS